MTLPGPVSVSRSGARSGSGPSVVILLLLWTLARSVVLLHEPLIEVIDTNPAPASAAVLVLGEDVTTLGNIRLCPASRDIIAATSIASAASEPAPPPATPTTTPSAATIVMIVVVPVSVVARVAVSAAAPVVPRVSLVADTAPLLVLAVSAQEAVRDAHIRNVGERRDHLVDVLGPQGVGYGGRHQAAGVKGGVVEGDFLEAPGVLLRLVLGQGLRVHAGSAASMSVWNWLGKSKNMVNMIM